MTARYNFNFRPRRETVDWLYLETVDVDQVVLTADVDALQAHVAKVTFCSLEGERCRRCRAPVDPALAKVLRLSQLTVEWLLHCQEVLEVNVHAAEQRRAAAEERLAAAEEQRRTQEEQIRELRVELKKRKKIIHKQQKMMATQIIPHKCLHCEKDFLNTTYLQNHMQQRHPDEFFASELLAGQKMKAKFDRLKSEVGGLKEQIVRQQQELEAKEALEEQQDAKMGKMRGNTRAETEVVQSRKDRQWKRRLEDMKSRHESEKKQLQEELSRMRRSVSEQQESSKRQQEQLTRRLQEKEQSIQTMKKLKEQEELRRKLHLLVEQRQSSKRLEEELSRRLQEKEHSIQTTRDQKDQLQEELSRMHSLLWAQQESSKRQQEELTRRLEEKSRRLQEKEQSIQTTRDQKDQEELSRMRSLLWAQQKSSKRQQEELTRRLEEMSRRLQEKEQSIKTMKGQNKQDQGCEKNQVTKSPWKKLKARLRGGWRRWRTACETVEERPQERTAIETSTIPTSSRRESTTLKVKLCDFSVIADEEPHPRSDSEDEEEPHPRSDSEDEEEPHPRSDSEEPHPRSDSEDPHPRSDSEDEEEPHPRSDSEDEEEPHPRSDSEDEEEPHPRSDSEDEEEPHPRSDSEEPHPRSDSEDDETAPEPRRDKPALTLIRDEDDDDAQYDYDDDEEEDEEDDSATPEPRTANRRPGTLGELGKRKESVKWPPGGVRIPLPKKE